MTDGAFVESKEAIAGNILLGVADSEEATFADDTLRMMFVRLHPQLSFEAQTALALRTPYLLFNEGYKASSGDRLVREDLCDEAIRLTGLLAGNPAARELRVHALFAVMVFNAARFPFVPGTQGIGQQRGRPLAEPAAHRDEEEEQRKGNGKGRQRIRC